MTDKGDPVHGTTARYGAAPDQETLDDLVDRIVRAVAPDRIILFGSSATGWRGPDSDLDVLVVKSGEYRRIDVMHAIRRELRGFAEEVDLVVATPAEMDSYSAHPGLVYRPALRWGKELYAA